MSHSAAGKHWRSLAAALAISVGVFALEVVAGLASNSLALLADAGHVFADTAGMALALGAIWLAARPATGTRSYGLYRVEIIAATANALLLIGVSAFVIYEGVKRLSGRPRLTQVSWLSSPPSRSGPTSSQRSCSCAASAKA